MILIVKIKINQVKIKILINQVRIRFNMIKNKNNVNR